jgi:hypothetical protein
VSLRDLGVHRLKDLGHPQHIFQVQAEGLTPDFPPLRSLDNPALANNLPVQLASFIGRDRELSELRRLVQSSRLVTLAGAGGSGKTRLALQVAAELLDGVWRRGVGGGAGSRVERRCRSRNHCPRTGYHQPIGATGPRDIGRCPPSSTTAHRPR